MATNQKPTITEGNANYRRQTIGLFGAPLLVLAVYFMPIAGLTDAGHTLLAIMTLVSLW